MMQGCFPSGGPFFHSCWIGVIFSGGVLCYFCHQHHKSAISFSNPMRSWKLSWKKRCLTDFENDLQNTNYDTQWKCKFFQIQVSFFLGPWKQRQVIAKTAAFNRGWGKSWESVCSPGASDSLHWDLRGLLEKAVVAWEKSTGKPGWFGILALSLTRPEQGQVFSLFLSFDFLPFKIDRIKTILYGYFDYQVKQGRLSRK